MNTALCVALATAISWAAPNPLLDPQFAGTTMKRGAAPTTGVRDVETFGLRLAPGGQGVARVGERTRLAHALSVEQSDRTLYVEAEAAEQIDAAERSVRVKADRGCVGSCVENPKFISIPFRINTPGERDVYARVREGKDEANRYFWTIDGGRRWLISKEAKGKKGQWRWINIGRVRLGVGDHRLLLHYYWRGEFHFDRFALLPKGAPAPQGLGPDAATVRPETGEVQTRDVTPPALLGLVRVRAKGSDAASYAVSLDQGKTWRDASDGDLSGVSMQGGGKDSLRFRITLPRLKGGSSPEITGVELTVRPAPAGWLAVRNDFVRVLLDKATGRLFRFTDSARGCEVLWPDEPMSLFSIDLKKRGAASWLRYSDECTEVVQLKPGGKGEQAKLVQHAEGLERATADATAGAQAKPARFIRGVERGGEVRLEYTIEQNVRLALRIALDNTAQTIWTADVDNQHPALDVIRLQFPRLPCVRLGGNGMDDNQLRTQTFGDHVTMPGIATLRNEKYPGSLTLPWESIYDDVSGFGVIVRDPRCTNVGFESKPDRYFGDTFSMSVRKYDNVAAAGGKATWEYAVAAHPGQWHWLADRYREWAVHYFVRPKYPDWFAESDGFYNIGIQNSGTRFRDLGKLAQNALRLGLRHMQVWGQFTGKGGGCCGPYVMPSPLYGTIEEFKQGIADVHAAGVKIGFYYLHDRVDLYHAKGSYIYGMIPKSAYPPGTEFPSEEMFVKHQWVGAPDGKPTAYPLSHEQWAEYDKAIAAYKADPKKNRPPRKWWPVDLAAPEWWEYLRHWSIDKYIEEYGADGDYYDVLGTGSVRESYDLRKGQHGNGLWGVGKAGIARTIVECARARGHKDYFMLMEGMCDVPGQWTAGMISGLYRNHSETMRYTWPGFILFEGHSNSGYRTPIKSLEAAFVNGNRFDIVYSNDSMWRIVDTRARVRDWIYRGRFMDTLGLTSPVPARLFIRRDPGAMGAAVTFVNRDHVKGEVRLDATRVGRVQRAVGVDQTGAAFAVHLTRTRGAIAFPLPTAHFATVVLAQNVDVAHGIIGGARLVREKGQAKIVVTLANLTGRDVSGKVVAPEFKPLRLAASGAAFTCASGGVTRVELPVEETPDFWRFARLGFDVEVRGRRVKRVETTVFPLVRDPSFEHTGNDTAEVFAGKQSLRLDPADWQLHKIYPLYLAPGKRYRISLAYKRTGGKSRMCRAGIWQRLGKQNVANAKALAFPKVGEWARAEATFTCAPQFVSTSLYLYNWNSEQTVWIDDVRVEEE